MAARKKTSAKLTRIRVNVSFNGMYRGDVADTVLDAKVQSWVGAGLVSIVPGFELEVTADGKDPAGQGSAEPSVPVDGTDGGGHSSASGGEQG